MALKDTRAPKRREEGLGAKCAFQPLYMIPYNAAMQSMGGLDGLLLDVVRRCKYSIRRLHENESLSAF